MKKYFYPLILIAVAASANQQPVAAYAQITADVQSNTTHQDPKGVRGNGVLEARDPLTIVNKTGAEVAILWMAPDQSNVKKGDLIFELDDSKLQRQLTELSVVLSNAGASSSEAESEMVNLKVKFETAITNANEEIRVAELNHRRLLGEGGQLNLKLNDRKARLAAEKRKLEYFNNKLKNLKSNDENQDELQEIQFKLDEAKLTANELNSQIEFLGGPEHQYLSAKHQLEIKKAKSLLLQLKNEFKTQLARVELELQKNNEELDFYLSNRKDLEHRIADCKIYAPQDGLLVHQNHFDPQTAYEFVVEEGALVRDRQAVAIMPDMDRLQVRVLIAEEDVDQIKTGQSASVWFESTKMKKCQGRVFRVGVFPEMNGWRNNRTKVYPVYIALDNCPKDIGLGATADVTIDIR